MSRSCVYIISCVDITALKIGFSSSPEGRMNTLKSNSPLNMEIVYKSKLMNSRANRIEKIAHDLLWKYKIRGEWFSVEVDHAIQVVHRATEIYKRGSRSISSPFASAQKRRAFVARYERKALETR